VLRRRGFSRPRTQASGYRAPAGRMGGLRLPAEWPWATGGAGTVRELRDITLTRWSARLDRLTARGEDLHAWRCQLAWATETDDG
jgi:hypothetical protein